MKFKVLNLATPMSSDDIERYYLEGWELISVVSYPDFGNITHFIYYFKYKDFGYQIVDHELYTSTKDELIDALYDTIITLKEKGKL